MISKERLNVDNVIKEKESNKAKKSKYLITI